MLRHKAVFGDLKAVDRSTDELAVLRKFPEPAVVEFRRGGDMGVVLNTVKKNRYVEVRAAVGAGKSTTFPLLVAKALGCLVIHTIPFHIAAHSLGDYLSGDEINGDKYVYIDDLDAALPSHGVVLMSNPFFFARLAFDRLVGVENAVLLLDESHESDCWTSTLRRLAPAIKSFRCVIKATATSAPGVQMTPDLPAKREIRTYRKVDVSTWSANDREVPWAASRIRTNVMMCIDRKQTRRNLSAQYQEYGFIVRDCTDESYEYFKETMRLLKDPAEGIVIVLVDYKFRSSFSIPSTGEFIDSCEVAVPTVTGGVPRMQYRAAYDFEVQQFLGRGARIAGCNAVLWRVDEPSPKMMCDLESLECDGANLLYRMTGFRPPLELIEYPYFKGDVPIDIAAAMASEHPLRLCPDESKVPWVNGHKALMVEKQQAAYEYDVRMRGRAKTVSCHTVADVERPRTPPPEVPQRYRRTAVDVDGLDEYRSSRDSSPSAVFTLDTDVYDNVTAALEASSVKPKRVAKRVLEARAAVEAERRKTEERLSGESMTPLDAVVQYVPDFPAHAGEAVTEESLARQQAGLVAQTGKSDDVFSSAVDGAKPLYSALREREEMGVDMASGKYYHYHGMENAPDRSSAFLRGLESIVAFCDSRDVKRYVKGLPEKDKLYAMRTLIDASNSSTAIAMGIQRLFTEVASRPASQWQDIVDHGAMLKEVEWMVARCTEEQARVRVYQSLIPLFAKYEPAVISAPLELEQRVMRGVMDRFERIAVKKDPDKIQQYWQRLNGFTINVGPKLKSRGRSDMMIEF